MVGGVNIGSASPKTHSWRKLLILSFDSRRSRIWVTGFVCTVTAISRGGGEVGVVGGRECKWRRTAFTPWRTRSRTTSVVNISLVPKSPNTSSEVRGTKASRTGGGGVGGVGGVGGHGLGWVGIEKNTQKSRKRRQKRARIYTLGDNHPRTAFSPNYLTGGVSVILLVVFCLFFTRPLFFCFFFLLFPLKPFFLLVPQIPW